MFIVNVEGAGLNFNQINVGGLRRLLICAGIGLILLGTGCTLKTKEESKPEIVSVVTDELISIPWNEGWTPAISVTPGIPIELLGSDKVAYEISGDTNYLGLLKEGRPESMGKTETIMKAEEVFYWNPILGNPPVHLDEIGTSWINIVRKQEGHSTGWVLIRISPMPVKTVNGNSGLVFKAEIIASIFGNPVNLYNPASFRSGVCYFERI